ncbi:hypothetical protein ACFO0N_07955 [Halobium salinum]|uniref:Uncharacterized protein n=1 Tax=Halobium salinum TaxID=1364940 RepID=A0ABD5PAF2_9EURY|nr:hypothetical protein [Halobium salinum]
MAGSHRATYVLVAVLVAAVVVAAPAGEVTLASFTDTERVEGSLVAVDGTGQSSQPGQSETGVSSATVGGANGADDPGTATSEGAASETTAGGDASEAPNGSANGTTTPTPTPVPTGDGESAETGANGTAPTNASAVAAVAGWSR